MSTSDREGMVAKMATLLNELDQFGELLAAARLSSAIDALVEKSTND